MGQGLRVAQSRPLRNQGFGPADTRAKRLANRLANRLTNRLTNRLANRLAGKLATKLAIRRADRLKTTPANSLANETRDPPPSVSQ